MKTIFRILLFSALAVYLTSLWNQGFEVSLQLQEFAKVTLFVALATYLVLPISKIVLLPFNLLTFGLVSLALYVFTLYLMDNQLAIITVKEWDIQKFGLLGFTFSKTHVSYIGNLILSAASLSAIIKTFEKLT